LRRILIIRLSAIGDIVMASPFVSALRARYPDAYIAWLVQPESRELLCDHPDLDATIVWPRPAWRDLLRQRRWTALLQAIRAFRRHLLSHGFDVSYDLQGLLKSGLLARLSGARERIGLGSREGSQWLMTSIISRHGGDAERIGSEYRYLAHCLGLPTARFPMAIHVSENAQAGAKEKLREQGVHAAYGVICPFTTRPQKHWLERAWLELLPALRATWGDAIVLLGGPDDAAAAAKLVAGVQVANLVGKTRLQEAAAIIRGARYLIGVDTGLTHLGTAYEIPTVALFGSTCPYRKTDSERTRIVYHDLSCSPCRRNPTCAGAFTCMRDITPQEVVAALEQVLPAP
jgi:heptosyltransferase-1